MSFRQIKGQEQAISLLKSALKHHRLAHCYLFCGPSGVGKKTTALALAQYLNCTAPTAEIDACENCASCYKIAHHEHADVITIAPEGTSIKLKQVEAMIRQAALRSYEGGYQVILIQ